MLQENEIEIIKNGGEEFKQFLINSDLEKISEVKNNCYSELIKIPKDFLNNLLDKKINDILQPVLDSPEKLYSILSDQMKDELRDLIEADSENFNPENLYRHDHENLPTILNAIIPGKYTILLWYEFGKIENKYYTLVMEKVYNFLKEKCTVKIPNSLTEITDEILKKIYDYPEANGAAIRGIFELIYEDTNVDDIPIKPIFDNLSKRLQQKIISSIKYHFYSMKLSIIDTNLTDKERYELEKQIFPPQSYKIISTINREPIFIKNRINLYTDTIYCKLINYAYWLYYQEEAVENTLLFAFRKYFINPMNAKIMNFFSTYTEKDLTTFLNNKDNYLKLINTIYSSFPEIVQNRFVMDQAVIPYTDKIKNILIERFDEAYQYAHYSDELLYILDKFEEIMSVEWIDNEILHIYDEDDDDLINSLAQDIKSDILETNEIKLTNNEKENLLEKIKKYIRERI